MIYSFNLLRQSIASTESLHLLSITKLSLFTNDCTVLSPELRNKRTVLYHGLCEKPATQMVTREKNEATQMYSLCPLKG